MISKLIQNSSLGTSCEITLSWINATEPHYWEVYIVSGNGLVLSGKKPLHELMLNLIYVAIFTNHIVYSAVLL